jgi:hypothetical protein
MIAANHRSQTIAVRSGPLSLLRGVGRKNMKIIGRLPRMARVTIWITAGLAAAIALLYVWANQLHGLLPLTPSQRKVVRATIENAKRIEIRRGGDKRATLVITNAAEIAKFGDVMTPRWQSFYCLCVGMTFTQFIDGEGRTNTANIADEYIKFGGTWADHAVFRMYQAVPPQPLLDLMAGYESELDRIAQPTPGGDSQPARRGSRTPQE